MARIDINLPLVTATGQKVELIETAGRSDFPLVGYFGDATMPSAWTKRGFVNIDETPHANDLINPPPEKKKAIRYVSWLGENLFNIDDELSPEVNKSVLSIVKVRFVEGQFDQ